LLCLNKSPHKTIEQEDKNGTYQPKLLLRLVQTSHTEERQTGKLYVTMWRHN